MDEYSLMQNMTDQQRLMFMSQMSQVRKDSTVGVLLAFFLGGFGAHRFYLGEIGLGVLYLVLCWTGNPSFVSFFEAFFMPGRVRRYNNQKAAEVAATLGTYAPPNAYSPVP